MKNSFFLLLAIILIPSFFFVNAEEPKTSSESSGDTAACHQNILKAFSKVDEKFRKEKAQLMQNNDMESTVKATGSARYLRTYDCEKENVLNALHVRLNGKSGLESVSSGKICNAQTAEALESELGVDFSACANYQTQESREALYRKYEKLAQIKKELGKKEFSQDLKKETMRQTKAIIAKKIDPLKQKIDKELTPKLQESAKKFDNVVKDINCTIADIATD